MNDLITKIVDCRHDNTVIASYPLSYPQTAGASSTPSRDFLIAEAKSNLATEGRAKPPFEGITFEIRDA